MPKQLQLAVTVFLLRDKLPVKDLGDMAATISNFLIRDLSLAQACKLSRVGCVQLLNLVWTRSLQHAKNSWWSVAKLLQTEPHYCKWQFTQALMQAVQRAYLCMAQWLLNSFPNCSITQEIVMECAIRGTLGILQVLEGSRRDSIEWTDGSLTEAAKRNHWGVVQWLHERIRSAGETKRMNEEVVNAAFAHNKFEQVKWAISRGYGVGNLNFTDCSDLEWGRRSEIIRYILKGGHGETVKIVCLALKEAAGIGDVNFVKWLLTRYKIKNALAVGQAVNSASAQGHFSVVELLLVYVQSSGLSYDRSESMFAAARHGKLEMVQWLFTRYPLDRASDLFHEQRRGKSSDCPIATTVMDVAAEYGHFEVLVFLQTVDIFAGKRQKIGGQEVYFQLGRLQCTTNAMDTAAANGHLSVVKWLHKHRKEGCTTDAMDNAAANGHLLVVQWLHRNRHEGCTLSALNQAARNGHQVVVQFLHLNRSEGCTSAAMVSAATARFHVGRNCLPGSPACCAGVGPRKFYDKQLEIIRWLRSRTSVDCTSAAMDAAAANGNLEMLQWFHENSSAGCTTKAMDSAAGIGRLDIVQWLHLNRWEGCTTAAMDGAATNGHLELVKWLYGNRSEGCTASAMDGAAARGHISVVQWLFFHCAGVRAKSAIGYAILSGNFEIVLFLHAHYLCDFSIEWLRKMKRLIKSKSCAKSSWREIESKHFNS